MRGARFQPLGPAFVAGSLLCGCALAAGCGPSRALPRGPLPRSSVACYEPVLGRFDLAPDRPRSPSSSFVFAAPGAVPVAGDWDGDGFDSIGVFVPTTGTFFLTHEQAGGHAEIEVSRGSVGADARPLAGDWSGGGRASVGVYLPSRGRFLLKRSTGPGGDVDEVPFGEPREGLVPVAGDWGGTGRASPGLYEPATGVFTLLIDGASRERRFGPIGGVPLAGDWEGSGRWNVGILDREKATLHLRRSNGGDWTLPFPSVLGVPIAGRWHTSP